MKIICSKNDLLGSINIVLKSVPAKTTMNILECILITAQNGTIKLTGNDLEMGIETIVKGKIEEEGIIAINAKIFSEIIRKLPDNDVTIDISKDYVTKIQCEKSKFNITGRNGSEFPALPVIEKDNKIRISQFTLREMIRQTVFSISESDANKLMTGELFTVTDNKLRITALDGHRIAIRNVELKEKYANCSFIVPGKALNEISKVITGELEDEVNIYYTPKHVMFELENTIILSRLIEGKFYDVNRMISGDYETKITINNKELFNCIDRAMLLGRDTEKKPIIMVSSEDIMEFKMNTQLGTLDEEIAIEKEGKDIIIGLNPKFMTDVLRSIDDEKIDMYMINTKAPCFIKDKNGSYMYVILPININKQS